MAQREVFRKANPRTFGIHAVVKRNLASEQVDMEKEAPRREHCGAFQITDSGRQYRNAFRIKAFYVRALIIEGRFV